MAWGCAPSNAVLEATRMIHDFKDTLRERYNRKTLTVQFPTVFDDMLANANDAKWEFWRSNRIQKCKIFYRQNKVTDSIGVVFVHTHVEN